MTIRSNNGFDEFINSRNKSFKVPDLNPKVMSYQDYMDLTNKGVYIDESYQIEPQTYTNLLRGIENHPDGCKITEQKPYHSWHNPGGKKEVVIQNREELEEEITQYLLNKYDEQENVHYSWREFFATFALVIYNVIIITIVFNVSLNWRLAILAIHAILLLFVGIFIAKSKSTTRIKKKLMICYVNMG